MPLVEQSNRPFFGLSISIVLHATLICVLAAMKNSPQPEVMSPQFVEVATIVLKPEIKDPISTVTTQLQAQPSPSLEPKTEKVPIKEKPKKTEKPKPKAKPKAKLPTKQVKSTPFSASPESDSSMTTASAKWNMEKTLASTGDNQEPTGKAGSGEGGSVKGNGGGGGGVSDSQGLVVLSRVLPSYPPRAEARGIEGWVRLEITATAAGTVSDARVVDASPKEIFDQAALEAIRRWRFKPAFKDGRAVAQKATLKLMFRLKKQH